jgi:hypothetical protein
MIPDITTGMSDWIMTVSQTFHETFQKTVHTFITSCGLNVARPVIPMPDFAVPYAAPTAEEHKLSVDHLFKRLLAHWSTSSR